MMKKIFSLLVIFILLIILVYVGRIKLAAFYNNQGIRYYDRSLYTKAVPFFKMSLRICSSMPVTHYNLAKAYAAAKLENEAIEEYMMTIRTDPSYMPAYRALANIYLYRSMYEEAISLIKQAQIYAPSDQGLKKEAISLIKQAQIYAPSDQGLKKLINYLFFEYTTDCLSRGVDAFLAQDKLKAYALLNTAKKIKPGFAYTYYTLGYFYYADRNYDKAEINLNEAIRIDPEFHLAYS